MTLTIVVGKKEGGGGNKVIADRRFYLNAEKDKLVGEGDPAARSLYCAAGKPILREEFMKLGGKITTAAAVKPKSDKGKSDDKSDKGKSEDKGKS